MNSARFSIARFMLLSYLGEFPRDKVDIPLNRKAKRPTHLRKLAEREVAKLCFRAVDQAKEQVLAIKFISVPCPACIRGKEFTHNKGIIYMFLRVEWGELFAQLLCQKLQEFSSLRYSSSASGISSRFFAFKRLFAASRKSNQKSLSTYTFSITRAIASISSSVRTAS